MVAEKQTPKTEHATPQAWQIYPWISKRLAKATGPACKLYFALAGHANYQTGRCYPSLETLAMETGLSTRTLHRALKSLAGLGVVQMGRWQKDTRKYIFTLRFYPVNGEKYQTPVSPTSEKYRTPVSKVPDTPVQNTGHQCPPNNRLKQKTTTKGTAAAVKPTRENTEAPASPDVQAVLKWWLATPGHTGKIADAVRVAAYPQWARMDCARVHKWVGNLGQLANKLDASATYRAETRDDEARKRAAEDRQRAAKRQELERQHQDGEEVTAEQWAAVGVEDPPASLKRLKFGDWAKELRAGGTGSGGQNGGDTVTDMATDEKSANSTTPTDDVRADHGAAAAIG